MIKTSTFSVCLGSLLSSLLILPVGAVVRAGQYQKGTQLTPPMDLGGCGQPVLYQSRGFTNLHLLGGRLAQAPSGRDAENRLLRSEETHGFTSPLSPRPSAPIASSTAMSVSYLSPAFLL